MKQQKNYFHTLFYAYYKQEVPCLVNSQTNYRQPSFGRFRFSNNAKEVVLSKINTPAKFKKFKELCELEETGDRARRNIDIFFVRHFTDRLYTEIGPKDYLQGIFQSTNAFLKKMTKKADELQKQKQTPGHSDIVSKLDKLIVDSGKCEVY